MLRRRPGEISSRQIYRPARGLCHIFAGMLAKNQTLAVLGCGTMGEAIVRGSAAFGAAGAGADLRDRPARRGREVAAREARHPRHQRQPRSVACGATSCSCASSRTRSGRCWPGPTMQTLLAGKLVISIAAGVRLDAAGGLAARERGGPRDAQHPVPDRRGHDRHRARRRRQRRAGQGGAGDLQLRRRAAWRPKTR